MKTLKIYSLLLIAFTFSTINLSAQESQDKRPPREKWSLVTMKGTVKDIKKKLKTKGCTMITEADQTTSGPASFLIVDPDGNPILVDQHF